MVLSERGSVKWPTLQFPNPLHLCLFPGKYLSSSPVGVGGGFTLCGECSRVQAGGRRKKMGPWWAGPGMPDVPVRNGPNSGRLFARWHPGWQTCKRERGHFGSNCTENGAIPDCYFWNMVEQEATLLPWPVAKKCWNWDATGERGRRRMPPHLRNLNSPPTLTVNPHWLFPT